MYSKVNQDLCIACGLCQTKAPAIFDYDEEGIAFVKQEQHHVSAENEAALMQAYLACPTHAILKQAVPFTH
ncbi:ferredoxin [Isobaculum melis]|uniref:Ferredoxin n=1 Tax=Isobaculum melis TaxID=142588 RepID=A0A1H9R8C0_9LACT|nr:ferredoxin [Isobaculum melis]SER68775.1 ferredoxin [Isobaculum melis]